MTSSLLNEIKIEIRSLLISSPHGLREDELCRDYSLFNCERLLPYQIFGYLTISDFLNSLTDILYRSTDGYIHPIVDQSTEHIYKLVQQQRTNKNKKNKKIKQIPVSYHQQSKPSIVRDKQKRAVASTIISSRQIPRTADTIKPCPMMKQMKIIYDIKVKQEDETFSRWKSPSHHSSPSFERINVTNDLLKNLLMHFRQQQQQK